MHRCRLLRFPKILPVSGAREEIARAIESNQVVIVSGETGSGKTTQLPKICLSLGRGSDRIDRSHAAAAHRRVEHRAAYRARARQRTGEVVGYKVRFTDHTRPGASIKLMTDGILLAETQGDPLLRAYDTLIIDEAHERSLNIDFLLGYIKQLLPQPLRSESHHHVGDDRRRSLCATLFRRRRPGADHRSLGTVVSGRVALSAAGRRRARRRCR